MQWEIVARTLVKWRGCSASFGNTVAFIEKAANFLRVIKLRPIYHLHKLLNLLIYSFRVQVRKLGNLRRIGYVAGYKRSVHIFFVTDNLCGKLKP